MSNEETTLKNKLYQALGTASMCWSETPKGVFDSTEAQKVGDELWEAVQKENKEVAIGFGNWIKDSLYVHEGVIRIKPEVAKQIGGSMNTTTLYQLYQQYLNHVGRSNNNKS